MTEDDGLAEVRKNPVQYLMNGEDGSQIKQINKGRTFKHSGIKSSSGESQSQVTHIVLCMGSGSVGMSSIDINTTFLTDSGLICKFVYL